MTKLLTLVLLVSLLSSVYAYHHWDHKVIYNSKVNLTCWDDQFWPENYTNVRYQWVLPTGEMIDSTSFTSSDQLTLLDNGSILAVSDIERHNFGLYLCLAMVAPYTSVHAVVKQGINIDGPYFGDLAAKYIPQAKIGMFAGLFIFVFMSMLCYNYDQFQERYDKPKSHVLTEQVALHTYQGTPLGDGEKNQIGVAEEKADIEDLKKKEKMKIEGETNQAFDASDLPQEEKTAF